MSFLETNTGLSSDEILRRAPSAEALAPFRQRFLSNNTHYLAAGSAAGVAAGTSWHALMKDRILAPLGMTATRTSVREAWNDPRTARGYWWDEAGQAARSFPKHVRAQSVHTARRTTEADAAQRTTGSVRVPASAVEGRFSSSAAGDDRLRIDLDFDGSVQTRTVLNKGRASAAVSGALTRELTGKQLGQTRLAHPSVLFRDWRKYYDTVRVVRAGELAGRKVYGVQLESAGLPPMRVSVDVETGDVLQTQQAMWFPEAGAIPFTTTYSDYREVGGMRVPHHYITSTEQAGRTIFQVERVEVGVEPAPDIFTLPPSTESGRGK